MKILIRIWWLPIGLIYLYFLYPELEQNAYNKDDAALFVVLARNIVEHGSLHRRHDLDLELRAPCDLASTVSGISGSRNFGFWSELGCFKSMYGSIGCCWLDSHSLGRWIQPLRPLGHTPTLPL